MTSAFIGHGVALKAGDGGGPEVFTTIAEIKSISGPGLAQDTPEATSVDSTSKFREYIAGLKDGGEVSFEMNFLPANSGHQALYDDMVAGTKRNFQIVFPDGSSTTWAFSAFVTAYEPSTPFDDVVTASVTLKITGVPTLP